MKILRIVLLLIVLLVLAACSSEAPRGDRPAIPSASLVSSWTLSFPIVVSDGPQQSVQIFRGGGWGNLSHFQALNLQSVRYSYGTSTTPGLFTDHVIKQYETINIVQDDWVPVQLVAGLDFTPTFMGNRAGTCGPVVPADYADFADMVRIYAELFSLTNVEIWNEPDFTGGMAGLFGCWGINKTDELVDLLIAVNARLDEFGLQTKIGVSFAIQSSASIPMIEAIEDHVDWIGVHYFGDWDEGTGWTVGYPTKIVAVQSAVNIPVFVTETNLRYTGDCTLPLFEATQAQFVRSVQGMQIAGFSVLELVKQSASWRCAAMLDNNGDPLPVYNVLLP